jgi:hypothetical protein
MNPYGRILGFLDRLDNLIEYKNIIYFNKLKRFKWLGHVERMPEEKICNGR